MSSPTNKSAGFYSGFMNQFNQKPTHKKREKPAFKDIRNSNIRRPKREKTRKFEFPLQTLATIGIIFGTVIVAFAALNWENIDFDNIPDIYAFQPVEDTISGERIIQYASTGIPVIFAEKAETAEIPVVVRNEEPESHHGMLVTFEWHEYKVKRGDVVSRIAENFGVSIGAIIASNEISNARRLQEGAVLRIPNIDGIPYQVKRGDSLSKISTSFNVPLDVILDVNDIKSDTIRAGETIFIPGARMNDIDLRMSLGDLFAYPLQSRFITSHFGMRKDPISGVLQFHDGVDFRGRIGTPVLASLDGTISVIGESWLYGKYIIMSHSNGYKTLYGHLNSYSVKQGDRVARGRKIGEVGNTGYSTGPHLHFGMYDKNGKLVNPLDLLN